MSLLNIFMKELMKAPSYQNQRLAFSQLKLIETYLKTIYSIP
jgi:hypothetical protein